MAGLSHSEIDDIVALLMRLNERGITIILIEHIMRAVMSFSQRLVVLVSGKKIADGKPDEVDPRSRGGEGLSWPIASPSRGIHAAYGAVRVLEDVSLNVDARRDRGAARHQRQRQETLMKCIMGMVRPSAGRIVAEIDGEKHDLVGRTTEQIVDLGIALVPEGRRLFPRLTVEENLLLGAFRPKARAQMQVATWTSASRCFPRLAERRRQLAGSHERRRAADAGARRAR